MLRLNNLIQIYPKSLFLINKFYYYIFKLNLIKALLKKIFFKNKLNFFQYYNYGNMIFIY